MEKIKLEELPPSIYIQYKDVNVQKVQATDTGFNITTKAGIERWRRTGEPGKSSWTKL